ncbi:SAF domain-containing protein [Microbacterium sp. GXF7504]
MTSTTPRPRARSVWVDPRFLIGIVVVAVSIAGVWFVVASARQTAPVLVAARTLVAGEPVRSGDVRVTEVALGTVADDYAVPGALADDAVALRTVPAGELVPVDAVGTAEAVRTTVVVVPSGTAVPAAVAAGTRVEVWVAPAGTDGAVEPPRILVADATVARLVADEALVASRGASLELVVPRADVPDLLAALAADAVLSVVPAAGGVP